MASAAEIRNALAALRNAPAADKADAMSAVITLGGQTALTIDDPQARQQFAASLGADIDEAKRA